ncbi:MAG: ATP-binding cassette domain-containing protein, partial [Rhodobacteraceae bacterium]|nr:ATP-binding cassette domain-containing protein [Paracoccaceae bacterium]
EMTGRDLSALFPPRGDAAQGEVSLKVRDLTAPGVRGVSFDLRSGEVLGVAGLAGAGRGALLRALIGALPRTGEVRLMGSDLPPAPVAAWAAGLAYVPRERRTEGLMLRRSIVENVALPHLSRMARGALFLDPRRQGRTAEALGQEVRLKAASTRQACEELSGGNQQKVLFARALAGDPKVLLLDEPTRGVDVGAKFDLYRLVRELAAEGVAVIVASSDLPELLGLSDRIAVLEAGRLTHMLENRDMSEADLLAHLYDTGGTP